MQKPLQNVRNYDTSHIKETDVLYSFSRLRRFTRARKIALKKLKPPSYAGYMLQYSGPRYDVSFAGFIQSAQLSFSLLQKTHCDNSHFQRLCQNLANLEANL